MSTAEQLTTIHNAVADVVTAIGEKGGSVSGDITTLGDAVRALPSGGDDRWKHAMLYGMNAAIVVNEEDFPSDYTHIPDYAFYYNVLVKEIHFPETITSSERCSFYISGIDHIDLSKTQITELPENCFYYCDVSHLELPSGLRSLPYCFLYNCRNLQNIRIPDSVTTIKSYAFAGWRSHFDYDTQRLPTINFGNTRTTIPTLVDVNAFEEVGDYGMEVYYYIVVPDALYDEWITQTNWSSTTNRIKNNIIKYSDAVARGII